MVAPIVYYHTDPGAPVLNGQSGSLINVLDACLVNGYGAKPAAGWTKEFSGTDLAAYRMGSGGPSNRHFLRVADNIGRTANLHGYASMSDINTGDGMYPQANVSTAGHAFGKSTSADATARPWMVVATAWGFYYLAEAAASTLGSTVVNGSTNLVQSGYFGAYEKYFTGHDDAVVLAGTVWPGWSGGSSAGQCSFMHVGYAGANFGSSSVAKAPYLRTSPASCLFAHLGYQGSFTYSSTLGVAGANMAGSTVSFVDGRLRMSPVEIVVATVGVSTYDIVGKMPGLFAMALGRNINATYLQPSTIGSGDFSGQQLISVSSTASSGPTVGYNSGSLVLNITDW